MDENFVKNQVDVSFITSDIEKVFKLCKQNISGD